MNETLKCVYFDIIFRALIIFITVFTFVATVVDNKSKFTNKSENCVMLFVRFQKLFKNVYFYKILHLQSQVGELGRLKNFFHVRYVTVTSLPTL